MAGFGFFPRSRIVCLVTFFVVSVSRAAVQSPRTAGVFMIIEGRSYTFNYTSARAACRSLNVTMATREQMERAVQQGMETCKYGWIAEQVAAIPRVTSDSKCGQGKRGVVLWRADARQKFGVFCFNASDFEETPTPSTAVPRTPVFTTALTHSPTQTPSPAASLVKSSTTTASSTEMTTTTTTTTTATQPSERTSASTVPAEATPLPRIPSTSAPPPPSSTRIPTSLPHLSTSSQAVVSETFPTSASHPSQSESPAARPALGAVPTSIIILAVILLLLTAAGAVGYHKQNIFTLGSGRQQKDDTETEMWKHTDSEMDLHSQQGAEEEEDYEESDRKYSSDITLCVNPSINFTLPE